MTSLKRLVLAAASAALVATGAYGATDAGRPVQTETIIIQPDASDTDDIPVDDKAVAPDSEAAPDSDSAPDSQSQEPAGSSAPAAVDQAKPADTGPPPAVEYDPAKLPSPVKRLREQIMAAALSGDIEKLRPIFDANGEVPVLGFVDASSDPVDFLKSQSGDPEGREILAILYEVLDAGYVHVDVGTPDEMYIWPYFARYPLDKLDGKQMVEMFKLLTAGDYEDMKSYGGYLFYRVGISPNGVWRYFVSGE